MVHRVHLDEKADEVGRAETVNVVHLDQWEQKVKLVLSGNPDCLVKRVIADESDCLEKRANLVARAYKVKMAK